MKKIICLLLIFSMVPVIAVHASDSSLEPNYNVEYISDCINLISAAKTDITFNPDYNEQITRAEFLIDVMKLLKISPSQNVNYTFYDVDSASELSQYIDAAVSLGIISKSASFYPDQPIKYSEAFKIMVVALGYALEAETSGGYPIGYEYSASNCGLTQDLTAYTSADAVSTANGIIMLRNFCEVPLRIQTGFGDTNSFTVDKDKNILTQYFSMYKISGIIDGNSRTGLYEIHESKKGCISINSVIYKCDCDYILGSGAEGYAIKNDTMDEIVYLKEKDTNKLTISHDDVISFKEGSLTYDNGAKNISVKMKNPVAFILNGKAYNSYTTKDFIKSSGTLTLIDNNDDKIYEVASWEVPEIMYIDKISKSSQAFFDTNTTKSISLSESDLEYELYFNSKPANFSEVIAGSVALVYYSADKTYLKMDISTKNITGVLTGFDNANRTMYVDDTAYKYSEYYATHYLKAVSMGKSYTFVLSPSGEICANYDTADTMKYGYLLKVSKTEGLAKDVIFKIYTEKGEIEQYYLADKVILDESERGKTDKEDIYSFFADGNGTREQVIRYSISSDNKIAVIDTESARTGYVEKGANPRDNLTRFSFEGDSSTTKNITYKGNKLFIPSFRLSSSCVIFNIIDDQTLNDEYRCSNTISFSNDDKIAGECLRPYNVSDSGAVDVLLYINKDAALSGASLPSEPQNGLVSSYRHILDEEGIEIYELGVYTPAGKFEYYKITDSEVTSKLPAGKNGAPISPGDYVRFAANAKNEITLIEKDFDVTSMKLLHSDTSHNTILRYYFAKPYSTDDSAFSFVPITNYEGYTDMNHDRYVLQPAGTVVKFDLKTQSVTPATMNDIITYTHSTDLCSNILIRSRYAVMTNIVIYE